VNKEEKTAVVADIHDRLSKANLAIMTEYRGLTVAQLNRLRRELKQVGGAYQVTKNTLTRRAIKDTAFEKLDEMLRGPTGLVTTTTDAVAVAKVLVKFAEQHDKLKITGGVLDGEVLPAANVSALAKLPSREVLLAQLLGLLNAPASQLLRTMQEPGARMARLLGALERAKQAAAPEPAASSPAAAPEPAAPSPAAAPEAEPAASSQTKEE
jgi:large subunit ribosomal protein L10